MKIMVTGAAGGYGHYAVDYVKEFAPEAEVYGLVRNADDAAVLEAKGIHARIGDYSDKASLVRAFEGIDRLLFVSVPVHELQIPVVEAAKEAGIKFIAYTSLHDPQYAKFGLEINHNQTEQLIRESGIPHTFLRNCWYLEMAAPLAGTAIKTGRYPYYAGDAKVSWALKRELAEAGAKVITGDGYDEILELGTTPVSYKEIGEAAQTLTDKNIEIMAVTKDEFNAMMNGSGIDQVGLMLGGAYQDYAIAGNNGEAESTPDTFEKVLGHPLTPLKEALKELI